MITTPFKTTALSVVATTDSYIWSNQYGGSWTIGSNWYDTTLASPVTTAPGAFSTVYITGGIGDNFTNILGYGATAQLTIANAVLVWGTIAVAGTLTLVGSGATSMSSELDLDGGANLTAAGVSLGNTSVLHIANGSQLNVSGTAILTDAFLLATNTGTIKAGGLIANPFIDANGLMNYGTIAVDGSAVLEIGTTGGAAAGAITIDQGMSATVSGLLYGNVVLNGTLGVQAGAALYIDVNNPFGGGQSIAGTGTLVIGQNSRLTLGVADSAAISFAAPGGKLVLYALPTSTIQGFVAGDTIVLIGLATGMSFAQTSANLATLTLTKGKTLVGTLTLAGNYANSLFHKRIDGHGNEFITLQTVGTAPVQPTLITGSAGYDTMIATANNQTITALGGNDSLSGSRFTAVNFKDTSANLNGCTITSFSAYDIIDLTDMKLISVTSTYTPAVFTAGIPAVPANLVVKDGIHSATILFSPSTPLPYGYWSTSTDGATGTNLKYTVIGTGAYTYVPLLGGSLSTLANWRDTTISAAATQQPSYGNSLTLAGGATYMNITGAASVASLTTSGAVFLTGSLSVGTVIQGFSGALTQTGTLALDSGASLVLAGSAAIGGLVEVGGGSKLTVAGLATFIAPTATLLAINGGTMRFAGVNTTTGMTFAPILYSPAVIGVDSKSSIEFGTAGNATAGALTIDTGVTANFGGTIDGNIVVNGTLAVANATLSVASFGSAAPVVSGSGTLQIGSGGTLTLAGSDTVAIQFTPAGDGKLALAGTLPVGTIGGFAKGDVIALARLVTGLDYTQTGANTGTLTLLNGTATVGTLNLAGSYVAQQFRVQFSAIGSSSTITYAAAPASGSGAQVSGNTNGYGWINTAGGNWTNAANWIDTTTGGIAVTAPGPGNAVVIRDNPGPSTSQIISGSGSATSLSISGAASTVFTGNIAVARQFYLGSFASVGVALTGGAQFSVGNLADYSALVVSGGSALNVTGLSGGSAIVGSLSVVGGSTVKAVGDFDIGGGIVAVDATSMLEYGSAGGVAAGTLTIDSGQTMTLGQNGAIAAKLMVNGTLAVSNGTLQGFGGTIGSIGGSGTIEIGAGRLTLNATGSAAVSFNPSVYGTLEVRGPLPTGTIGGFAAGDTIQLDQTVTGAGFVQTTSTKGTLTLTNGAATVGTLTFAGNYAASLFQVDVSPATGVATLSLQTATTTAGSAAANTGRDAFSWTGANGGSWNTAANWIGTTTNAIATTMPDGLNAVTINGGSGQYTTIGGNGADASLTIGGNVLLTGQITTAGQLAITPTAGVPAALALTSGAKITAAIAAIAGTLQVGGGGSATIAGTAYLAGGTLLALNGGTVQLGGLIGGGSGVIAIDASSVIKIGSVTGAAAGTLTQAAGAITALTGSIYGNVLVNGTLAVAGGGSLFIDMTGTAASNPYQIASTIGGTGTLSVSEGSTLGLGAIASTTIQFAGPNATLVLAALPAGPIRGFVAGETIQINQTVTGIAYTQVTPNTGSLALTNGTAMVGALRFAGNYGSLTQFHIDSAPNGATATITLQTLGNLPVQPTFIQGTMASDLLTATAPGQTLTGLGGGDTLGGGGFTSVAFKDLTANLNGDTIQGFVASDWLDFTDMNPASATVTFSNGNVSVTDGVRSATLGLGFATVPAAGAFHTGSDGATGTKLTWS